MIQVVRDDATFDRVLRESNLAETGGTLRLVRRETTDEVLVTFQTHRGPAKIQTTTRELRKAVQDLEARPVKPERPTAPATSPVNGGSETEDSE